MFGIEKPIVQGGMQHLGIAEFASLVCNAGGMGTINITCYPGVDEFHEDVIKMKEFTNNKPFIVNISLVPDLTKGEEIFKYIDVCAKEGVAAIEKEHEERYRKLLANIEGDLVFSKDGDVIWQCSNCGHICVGKKAPEVCPVCNHSQAYFQVKAENY